LPRFYEELGSGSADDELKSSSEDDQEAEDADNRAVALYKVSDAGGEMQVEEVSGKPLKKEMLDQNVSEDKSIQRLSKTISLSGFAVAGEGNGVCNTNECIALT